VLMSFTIGRDLGLVLAKGVVFSLLCVFTMLPFLIIKFDNLLLKTKKNALHPKGEALAVFSHKARWPIFIAFLLVFGAGFVLRNSADASFVLPSMNEQKITVDKYFPKGSQVVLIYSENDRDAMVENEQIIAQMPGIKKLDSYSSTLGKQYTAAKLAYQMGMDESFVKLLYYYQQTGENDPDTISMTLSEFCSYIKNDVLTNPTFAEQIKEIDTSQIDKLALLGDASAWREQRSASSMAQFMGQLSDGSGMSFDEETVNQLYGVYAMVRGGTGSFSLPSLTLTEFSNFMVDEVMSNPEYSGMFTEEQKQQMTQLQTYSNVEEMTRNRNYREMAEFMGASRFETFLVYLFTLKTRYSVQEFLDASIELAEDGWTSRITEEELAQMKEGKKIIDTAVAGTRFSYSQLASFLGMESSQARSMYALYAMNHGLTSGWKLSAFQMIEFLCSKDAQQYIGSYLDDKALNSLEALRSVVRQTTAGTSYTATEMNKLLSTISTAFSTGDTAGFDENAIRLLYLFKASQEKVTDQQISLEDFVNFMVQDVVNSPLFAPFLDDATVDSLQQAQQQMLDGRSNLVNGAYYRVVIVTSFASESQEMLDFLSSVDTLMHETTSSAYYLVGEGPMARDMSASFMDELNFITIVTTLAIMLIVLLTFRNILIAALLVALIQCSFFWTMALNGLMGSPMYYLAIIIVQAILMGATIDYAILFTNNYRRYRATCDKATTLKNAYIASIPTMLTSGTILVTVTFVLGMAMGSTSVAKICLTIAEGSFIALLLVVFVLPGVLAVLDRFVCKTRAQD